LLTDHPARPWPRGSAFGPHSFAVSSMRWKRTSKQVRQPREPQVRSDFPS
jgi:hypothetical protein